MHARQISELDGLTRQRKNTGDDRLRRDDRRDRGQKDHGIKRPRRREQVKRVVRRRRLANQQRALSEILQDQRRANNAEPVDLNGALAEMSEVGVERLAAGGDQENCAQHQEAVHAIHEKKTHSVHWIDREEHRRLEKDSADAGDRERREPQNHDRTEHRPHPCRPSSLKKEQDDEDDDRDRNDIRLEKRRRDFQPFDGAQD